MESVPVRESVDAKVCDGFDGGKRVWGRRAAPFAPGSDPLAGSSSSE